MKLVLIVLVVVVLGFAAYVRLAPSDPKDFHKMPDPDGPDEQELDGGFVYRRDLASGAGRTTLEKLNEIALATPRTTILAGSVAEGMITYITRSALWAFPDYTTVALVGPDDYRLVIRGHLRFGKSDLGVNQKRIMGWIDALDARS